MQRARSEILRLMKENRQTKIKIIMNCEMVRQDLTSGNTEILNAYFHTNTIQNHEATNESEVFDNFIKTIEERIQNFNKRGSNWRFQKVISLDIQMVEFRPLNGSSYIPLPKFIANKNAVVNMKNEDIYCFKWSITRALNPVGNHPERIDKKLRVQSEKINCKGIKFRVELSDLKKFENQNKEISINVFGYEREIYLLRISEENRMYKINLLLIEKDGKKHYCLIKNMNRLLSMQVSIARNFEPN